MTFNGKHCHYDYAVAKFGIKWKINVIGIGDKILLKKGPIDSRNLECLFVTLHRVKFYISTDYETLLCCQKVALTKILYGHL